MATTSPQSDAQSQSQSQSEPASEAQAKPSEAATAGDDGAKGESDAPDTPPKATKMDKLRRVVFLPYIIGLIWTSLHPSFSVLTGESKCRGWFIDENSLNGNHVVSEPGRVAAYLSDSMPPQRLKTSSICDTHRFLESSAHTVGTAMPPNMPCHRAQKFDVLSILPSSGAIQPIEEAIVIVVPMPKSGDWSTSLFHFKFMKLMHHLANPTESPWLAKAIHVVSPSLSPPSSSVSSQTNTSTTGLMALDDTVQQFLDAHSGRTHSSSSLPSRRLPQHVSSSIIRNLLVVDANIVDNPFRYQSAGSNEFAKRPFAEIKVMPQGRHGVLPNMDMVFIVAKTMTRTTIMHSQSYPRSLMVVHPYLEEYKRLRDHLGIDAFGIHKQWVDDAVLNRKLVDWADDFINMAFFAYTMVMGPSPPHAPALSYGIDSVTIEATIHGEAFARSPMEDFLEYLGFILRNFSNLHERLHHSETLYLMPTPRKFVSHMEYFLPCVLLLLPLVIRSVHLLTQNLGNGVHFEAIACWFLCAMLLPIALLSCVGFGPNNTTPPVAAVMLFLSYGAVTTWIFQMVRRDNNTTNSPNDTTKRITSTMHLCGCLLAIYVHVPLAFGHISVAYPSALLWSFVLASGGCGTQPNVLRILFWCIFAIATCPLVWPAIMPDWYCTCVWMPLHVNVVAVALSHMVGQMRSSVQ